MAEIHKMYLRLPKFMARKVELSLYLEKYDKLEINRNLNKGLKDPTKIKVIPYASISRDHIHTILGCCKKYAAELKIPILNGVQSAKIDGSISYKTLNKLIAIEEQYNINLGIPKTIKKLIKTKYPYHV